MMHQASNGCLRASASACTSPGKWRQGRIAAAHNREGCPDAPGLQQIAPDLAFIAAASARQAARVGQQ